MPSELTPKQKKTLERLAKIVEGGGVAILENLLETEQKVEEEMQKMETRVEAAIAEVKASVPNIQDILEQVKGKPGYTPVKGVDYQDGEPGAPGENYILTAKDKKEIAKSITVPVVEKVIQKTEVVREQPIVTEVVKEVAVFDKKMMEKQIPQMGERLRDSLELLPDGEKLKIEAIQDLSKILEELKKKPAVSGGSGAVSGRNFVIDIDISDSFNGVLKTFNIQAVWRIISVDLSSYPYGSLRKSIDYNWTPTSLSFTSEIDASTQLSAGTKCIITAII